MKEYDFTTLAGFKEAALELINYANENKLYCCPEITSNRNGLTLEVRIYRCGNYPGDLHRIWDAAEHLTPEGIASTFAEADRIMHEYIDNGVARAEAELREAEAALEAARAKLEKANKAQEGK